MGKLERLLNLSALLLQRERPVPIDRIHELIDGYPDDPASFRRAFERDKDELRALGVRIEVRELLDGERDTAAGSVGYVIAADGFYLEDPGLSAEERMALELGLAGVELASVDRTAVLRKLGASAAEPQAPVPVNLDEQPSDATVLVGCALDRRTARFTYRGAVRQVEVKRLEYRGGHWYVTGFDRHADAYRSFRLDRIESEVIPGDEIGIPRNEPAPPLVLERWKVGDGEAHTVRLRVDSGLVHAVSDRFDAREIDGALHFDASDLQPLVPLLAAYGEEVEVLEPTELRDAMRAHFEGLVAVLPEIGP